MASELALGGSDLSEAVLREAEPGKGLGLDLGLDGGGIDSITEAVLELNDVLDEGVSSLNDALEARESQSRLSHRVCDHCTHESQSSKSQSNGAVL